MGIYAKVVSVQKEINDIKVKVGNNVKQIESIWTEVDGIKRIIYPEDGVIVNLLGSAKYESDTVWPAGRYSVDVQAGGGYMGDSQPPTSHSGGRVVQTININAPFVIRAYSGSKGSYVGGTATGGTNPYSGPYKVNARSTTGTPAYVDHIFGNAASADTWYGNVLGCGGGNCLGDGAPGLAWGVGAGSCLHFIPVGGTFGTDYLAAFHTTGAAPYASTGSAYGGAASGSASDGTGSAGGSTPYGAGGAAVTNATGKNGTGIGHGIARHTGASAWFDGTEWRDSDVVGVPGADGHIIIKYVGPIE